MIFPGFLAFNIRVRLTLYNKSGPRTEVAALADRGYFLHRYKYILLFLIQQLQHAALHAHDIAAKRNVRAAIDIDLLPNKFS